MLLIRNSQHLLQEVQQGEGAEAEAEIRDHQILANNPNLEDSFADYAKPQGVQEESSPATILAIVHVGQGRTWRTCES